MLLRNMTDRVGDNFKTPNLSEFTTYPIYSQSQDKAALEILNLPQHVQLKGPHDSGTSGKS